MGTAPHETPPADDETALERDEAASDRRDAAPLATATISGGEATALRVATIVKHVALALAICASAALVIDYKNAGDPAFCGVQSGCFAVRASAYSHVYGIPLPNLALPAFAILLGLSIYATNAASHRLVAGAAGLGALFAVAFIALQAFFVGAFCPWCVAVDSSAIVAGVASILIWFWIRNSDVRASAASVQGASAGAWAVTGAIAIGLPFVWASYPAIPPAPPEIVAQQQPGKVTIISFTDFECPFCRKLHPALDELRSKHGDKIAFIRKMKPLSGHPGAMPAAKAWVCAPLDKRDAVASALYETEPEHLKTTELVGLATKLGLGDPDAYAACMKAKSTEDAIDRDAQEFSQIKGRGLPFTYVNSRQIIGFNPDKLTTSVERELGGPSPALPVWAMFAALGLAVTVASALTWRSPKSAA
ncbi:MAG: vitamin K epoxide reductase family protein [Polyangiaceae bacterium]